MLENPAIITADPQHTAVVRGTVPMDRIREFYDKAFPAAYEAAAAQGIGVQGAFGHYLSMPAETVDLEVGFVTDAVVAAAGEVVPGELPGGELAHASYVGAYDGLGGAWQELFGWISEQGRQVGPSMWEVYVTDPTPETDPATLRTDLFWPLV
ncbi:GyrI-like domain-containing protein [Aestuariimicrobium sp. Y1814]|uniref:GyrI-like domain-containing protein n=1 Tax=Aestuariimicrobium sp. Y1814 TaxID=3418742 RepID=UPI003DA75AB3